MPWGFTVLTFVAGLYIVSDPFCESFAVEIPCYYLNCLYVSKVPRYYRVVTALGYLGLERSVFREVSSIFVI